MQLKMGEFLSGKSITETQTETQPASDHVAATTKSKKRKVSGKCT